MSDKKLQIKKNLQLYRRHGVHHACKFFAINFLLVISSYSRYNITVMIISFEASANIDTTLFGYFSMQYDAEFFSDIKENLTEISKDDIISFKLDPEEVKLLHGSYENVRRIISLPEVEKNKFTNVFKRKFDTSVFKKFKNVKLHIDKDYFYFTGRHENKDGTKPVEFQSLNFDVRFLESLENTYKSMVNQTMNSHVWIYFSKTGVGYELTGTDVISGFDAFVHSDGTYLIEYSYSDLMSDMHFFIYEWDNSQKKRKTVFESYKKELVLMGMAKHMDKIPLPISQKILSMYVNEDEELELEKNANS